MKKIIIIYIIAFCLLSFMEISFLAEEPFNYGEFWNSISDREKTIFLVGMTEGISYSTSYYTTNLLGSLKTEEERTEELTKILDVLIFLPFSLTSNREVIKNIISDLYKDPANAYISIFYMSYLAYRKLKG
ncbi:unnamed protein product, partial [marine sediment metagenome]